MWAHMVLYARQLTNHVASKHDDRRWARHNVECRSHVLNVSSSLAIMSRPLVKDVGGLGCVVCQHPNKVRLALYACYIRGNYWWLLVVSNTYGLNLQ